MPVRASSPTARAVECTELSASPSSRESLRRLPWCTCVSASARQSRAQCSAREFCCKILQLNINQPSSKVLSGLLLRARRAAKRLPGSVAHSTVLVLLSGIGAVPVLSREILLWRAAYLASLGACLWVMRAGARHLLWCILGSQGAKHAALASCGVAGKPC